MTFTKGVGTPKYMAPEILNRQRYKKSSDVYSFAVTMLEVMLWEEPFPKEKYKYAWDIANAISAGKRPDGINQINEGMKKIIESSWCQYATERLTIEDIVALLETELLK